MTITMQYSTDGGSTWTSVSSALKFTAKSPWTSEPKITTHEIDGADYDLLYHRGRHSATCTVRGYCRRTSANVKAIEDLKDGRLVRVMSTVNDATYRQGLVTSATPTDMGGSLFVSFSLTVVEQ